VSAATAVSAVPARRRQAVTALLVVVALAACSADAQDITAPASVQARADSSGAVLSAGVSMQRQAGEAGGPSRSGFLLSTGRK
jgi:hypothetical protein